MKCRTIHKKLIFYIEGDLPENEMQEVSAHLTECSHCEAFASEIRKTLAIVQNEKQVPVSPYFYTRLKARMENQEEAANEKARFPVWERFLQPAFFTFLLLAGMYFGIMTGRQAGEIPSSSFMSAAEVIPFLNELEAEPLESFLME